MQRNTIPPALKDLKENSEKVINQLNKNKEIGEKSSIK